MKVTNELISSVFRRTGGDCHICHEPVGPRSYGKVHSAVGWEIDHSVPRSKGGADRANNLYPAHVSCNRSKGAKSTTAARRVYGHTAAPRSTEQRTSERQIALLVGIAAGGLVGYWVANRDDVFIESKWIIVVGCSLICGVLAGRLYK